MKGNSIFKNLVFFILIRLVVNHVPFTKPQYIGSVETISSLFRFEKLQFIIILRLSFQFYQYNWNKCIPLLDIYQHQIESIVYPYSLRVDGPCKYDHNNHSSQRRIPKCPLLTLSNTMFILDILNCLLS
jgi:hypothetical protein